MKSRMNDFTVGLAVIAVIAALVASLAWVRQADIGERRREVVAHMRDVGNARVGNAVVIRGVIAGRLQSIELAGAGWVQVRLKLDREVELPQDPVVLLSESSLFGEWQVAILSRSALPRDDQVLKQIAEASGTRGTLAGATLPGVGKLTAVAGQIAGDVANVAARFEAAFDDQAAREMRASIKNVSDLSTILSSTVKSHASDLDTVAAQLRTAIASINRTASNVQRMAEQVDASASSGDVRKIVDNISTASADLRKATAQVHNLAVKFTASQGRLDAFLANGDSVLMKVNAGTGSLGLLVNDPSLYRRVDSTLVQLQALITDMKANPRKYLKISVF
jgi:phospholipid/cholesterol/gamma-HCH transport system substrate-binding protein